MNRYPLWKYLLLAGTLLLGMIYSAPILYGEVPAVQISVTAGNDFNRDETITAVQKILDDNEFKYRDIKDEEQGIIVRLADPASQIKAKDLLRQALDVKYIVALNLAPATPPWLAALGASPMKLGLDLRGGVHFLMEIDVNTTINRRVDSYINESRTKLRQEKIRYNRIEPADFGSKILFKTESDREQAHKLLRKVHAGEFEWVKENNSGISLLGRITPTELQNIRNYTVEQTITTLRNRVNELGVAEAVVQRQGQNHVVVELPGVQDTARAKEILGKTATLEFKLQDNEHDAFKAMNGRVPVGSTLYNYRNGPVLLKKRVILSGDSITGAVTGTSQRDGLPTVDVRVGGAGLSLFKKATKENVNRSMAVVYIESRVDTKEVNGEIEKEVTTTESVISLANIIEPLGTRFQITGLGAQESVNLAILLRAGALPAAVSIVEERTVGPSLGEENIRQGIISIQVGMALVLLAMVFYYRFFGLIANVALMINIVLLVAVLSLVGATLTLPGIAGIVLTVGMAVDANVLIFERIREELRNGMSPQAAIHSGFDRAFSTIIDANVTTLIVGIILFSVGTGPVRGFAVTLCIGILTSMLTAIAGTRAMVNLSYGSRNVKKLSVGI